MLIKKTSSSQSDSLDGFIQTACMIVYNLIEKHPKAVHQYILGTYFNHPTLTPRPSLLSSLTNHIGPLFKPLLLFDKSQVEQPMDERYTIQQFRD